MNVSTTKTRSHPLPRLGAPGAVVGRFLFIPCYPLPLGSHPSLTDRDGGVALSPVLNFQLAVPVGARAGQSRYEKPKRVCARSHTVRVGADPGLLVFIKMKAG